MEEIDKIDKKIQSLSDYVERKLNLLTPTKIEDQVNELISLHYQQYIVKDLNKMKTDISSTENNTKDIKDWFEKYDEICNFLFIFKNSIY
jgi:hypothetical protein